MKRGNIESAAVKLMLMAASIVLTCVLIGVGNNTMKQSRQLANAVTKQISDFGNGLVNSGIMQYDGMEVKGSDVINFYKKHFGGIKAGDVRPFILQVKTTQGTNTYTDGIYLDKMKDSEDVRYIKPTAKFSGIVTSNSNGVITKVEFVQK